MVLEIIWRVLIAFVFINSVIALAMNFRFRDDYEQRLRKLEGDYSKSEREKIMEEQDTEIDALLCELNKYAAKYDPLIKAVEMHVTEVSE